VFARRRLIWTRRQGPRAKASRECYQSVDLTSTCNSDFLTRVDLFFGSARSLSDRVWSLSDRHLAQPDLCPIVLGLCPIVTWLNQVSVRSCRVCPIVIWLNLVSVRSCRVSVRSSLGSARSLSDRVGSLSNRHLSLSNRVRSLSDRHLAQPGLCPIVSGLYSIVILLCLFLRVVCRWPDSFCDL
jgi:hypothetical protein